MADFIPVLTQDTLVTSILMGLVALVGLVGNVLMIRALIQYRHLRTEFYTVFGCLSVVDSLFLIVSVPAHIMDMLYVTNKSFGVWCKGSHYMISSFGLIAAYLMVVLAVLRGILLTNRNIVRRPQARHLLIVCTVICVITMLCSVPVMFMFTAYDSMCDYVDPANEQSRYTWLMVSFSAFVPLFLVVIIYIMTYLLGKRYFADSYSPREKEKSRLVSSIIIAFAICHAPYRIFTIYELNANITDPYYYERMFVIKNYLMCLVMADKAVRPILYTKLASDLCEAFDEVINCVYCSRHYSMTSRFRRPMAAYSASCTTPGTVTTLISSTENHSARTTERTVSSSSSTSATSQTPLTRKDDDADLSIQVLLDQDHYFNASRH